MKSLIINVFGIILFAAFTFSCGEDEKNSLPSEPVLKLTDNTVSYSLEKSNLLLLEEGVEGDFNYRNYVITDGEYIDGRGGHELGDYTNASYFIIISLGTRESFSNENYIQSNSWDSESGDFLSYLYMSSIDDLSIYTGNNDHRAIKISGGFDDGEIMKIEFKGELMYTRFDPSAETIVNTAENAILFFEGTVDDKR